MNKKLLLTGTFCSGKTTLVNKLRKYPGTYVIDEIARPLLAKGTLLMFKPEFQQILLEKQLEQERLAETTSANLVICDRGIIDIECYSRYFGYPLVYYTIREHRPYDIIFLCSPSEIDVAPVYGEAAIPMRDQLHNIFIRTLDELGLKYKILVGSRVDRLRELEISIVRLSDINEAERGIKMIPKKGKERM